MLLSVEDQDKMSTPSAPGLFNSGDCFESEFKNPLMRNRLDPVFRSVKRRSTTTEPLMLQYDGGKGYFHLQFIPILCW